jgi:hypothetical protein
MSSFDIPSTTFVMITGLVLPKGITHEPFPCNIFIILSNMTSHPPPLPEWSLIQPTTPFLGLPPLFPAFLEILFSLYRLILLLFFPFFPLHAISFIIALIAAMSRFVRAMLLVVLPVVLAMVVISLVIASMRLSADVVLALIAEIRS